MPNRIKKREKIDTKKNNRYVCCYFQDSKDSVIQHSSFGSGSKVGIGVGTAYFVWPSLTLPLHHLALCVVYSLPLTHFFSST